MTNSNDPQHPTDDAAQHEGDNPASQTVDIHGSETGEDTGVGHTPGKAEGEETAE